MKVTRQTKQKEIILKAIQEYCGHPSADDLFRELKDVYPKLSLATIYRNLKLFTDEGKLIRIISSDGPQRFDLNASPHGHVICSRCGKVFDLPYSPETDRFLRRIPLPEEAENFKVQTFRFTIEGLCCACQREVCNESSNPDGQQASAPGQTEIHTPG